MLRRLKTGYFDETTILIGEAGGNNLSILEKVFLRTVGLKSFEDIFLDDQFVIYVKKMVYIASPTKESVEEKQPMEVEGAQQEQSDKQAKEAQLMMIVVCAQKELEVPTQEELMMMEEEALKESSDKTIEQQPEVPEWMSSSPPSAAEERTFLEKIEELDLTKLSSVEQESSSAQLTKIPQVLSEVLSLKNACLSAFQALPSFISLAIKNNIQREGQYR